MFVNIKECFLLVLVFCKLSGWLTFIAILDIN